MSSLIRHFVDLKREDARSEVGRLEEAFWREALYRQFGSSESEYGQCRTVVNRKDDVGVVQSLEFNGVCLATLDKGLSQDEAFATLRGEIFI